jgi:hypothetical protein
MMILLVVIYILSALSATFYLYLDTKENKVYLTLGELLFMILAVVIPVYNTIAAIYIIVDRYKYTVVWRKK